MTLPSDVRRASISQSVRRNRRVELTPNPSETPGRWSQSCEEPILAKSKPDIRQHGTLETEASLAMTLRSKLKRIKALYRPSSFGSGAHYPDYRTTICSILGNKVPQDESVKSRISLMFHVPSYLRRRFHDRQNS